MRPSKGKWGLGALAVVLSLGAWPAVASAFPSLGGVNVIGRQLDYPVATYNDSAHLWILNAGDFITELDATTHQLIDVIGGAGLGMKAPTAMAGSGGKLWILDAGKQVIELDMSTGTPVRAISKAAAKLSSPSAVVSDGSHIWISNFASNSVSELDASTGSLLRQVKGNATGLSGPVGMSFDGKSVWVANWSGNSVTEIDASTGAVAQVLTGSLSAPSALYSDGSELWVASTGSNSIEKFAESSNTQPGHGMHVASLHGVTAPDQVVGSGSQVIASSPGTGITEFAKNGNAVIRTVPGIDGHLDESGGSVVTISRPIANRVLGFDASTGATSYTVEADAGLFDHPDDVVATGGNIYVRSGGDGSVTLLDGQTGVPLQRFTSAACGLQTGGHLIEAFSGIAAVVDVDAAAMTFAIHELDPGGTCETYDGTKLGGGSYHDLSWVGGQASLTAPQIVDCTDGGRPLVGCIKIELGVQQDLVTIPTGNSPGGTRTYHTILQFSYIVDFLGHIAQSSALQILMGGHSPDVPGPCSASQDGSWLGYSSGSLFNLSGLSTISSRKVASACSIATHAGAIAVADSVNSKVHLLSDPSGAVLNSMKLASPDEVIWDQDAGHYWALASTGPVAMSGAGKKIAQPTTAAKSSAYSSAYRMASDRFRIWVTDPLTNTVVEQPSW